MAIYTASGDQELSEGCKIWRFLHLSLQIVSSEDNDAEGG